MFSRFTKDLKGFNLDNFLDSKIAEEQAKQGKQGQQSGTQKRSPSNVRRGSGRTDSPSRRAGSRLRVPEGDSASIGKTPDPEEFVIGDDASDISRAATPRPARDGMESGSKEDAGAVAEDGIGASEKGKAKQENDELPEDVVQRLAKLESLTNKYKELLRNYRTAHARVAQTEAFEATLREHTPLANVSDPGALVEFLNQRGLQSEMVLEELKRVTGEQRDTVKERDELKVKLADAEKRAKEAFDDAAGLRKEREEQASSKAEAAAATATTETDPLGADIVNDKPQEAASEVAKPQTSEDGAFLSYDSDLETQIKEHDKTIKEQRDYINELETENATTRQDFEMTRLDLEAMKNKITIRDREISSVSSQLTETRAQVGELEKSRAVAQEEQESAVSDLVAAEASCVDMQQKLKSYQENLRETHKELEEKAAAAEKNAEVAEENLKKYQAEHEKNVKSGKFGGEQQERRMKISQDVIDGQKAQIKQLEEQVKQSGESKAAIESQVNDLKFEMKRLEAEGNHSQRTITSLRQSEANLEVRTKYTTDELTKAQTARDDAQRIAETKKGHEAAAANLRLQLKEAQKDRDAAYQMIVDCGKCKMPEHEQKKAPETPTESSDTPRMRSPGGSETTERTESTQPTEASTPTVEGGEPLGAEAKKRKKKKSKAKKKAPTEDADSTQPSVADLIADPSRASGILKNSDNAAFMKAMEGLANLRQSSEAGDADHDSVLKHHEEVIEQRDQTIKDNVLIVKARDEQIESLQASLKTEQAEIQRLSDVIKTAAGSASAEDIENLKAVIKQKDAAIDRLDAKLKGEEGLIEELEQLRADEVELAIQTTNAKHEVTLLRASKQKLQEEFDELQRESDNNGKSLKDAQAQRDDLARRCSSLETEISELKSSQSTTNNSSAADLQAATEKLESAEREKASLNIAKEACEKQIEELKAQHSANGAELDSKHNALLSDFAGLKTRANTLDSDLAAANQLAQSRYKDLTDLKEHLNKVQPELKKLRVESAELKTVKSDLEKSNSTVKKLESKERDLRSEIAEYKSQGSEKDGEITKLKEQAKKSEERCTALEDTYERARKDLEQNELTRDDALDTRDKLQSQLEKTQLEVKASKSSLEDLEKQAKKLGDEAAKVKDELQMKSAQHDSAQGLMDSMQDQSRELATQMKEVRERCESLDEELADAHRLLSERSREGDTMRRLLADVESRAESRVKEMRERMDLAVEERDRAEDEASTIGRRKAREIEDLKNKVRDAEREAARASEARNDAEKNERVFKSKQDDLERRAAQAQEELTEVRTAMAQLRDALDEGERQSRSLEKEKSELRNTLSERESRLEKLQKSSKGMAEEMLSLQTSKIRQASVAASSRSSMESSRVMSPGPGRSSNGAPAANQSADAIDYVYLKNVLLQFLETKEKKHQMQLVPVLGMLLHFDKQDQQKWMSAVSAK